MPTLTIRHKRHWFEPKLPHSVFLNGYFVGMLKDDQLYGDSDVAVWNKAIQGKTTLRFACVVLIALRA